VTAGAMVVSLEEEEMVLRTMLPELKGREDGEEMLELPI